MTVLVLDPRWPDMIPIDAAIQVEGPVTFTGEVPVAVRWNFDQLVRAEASDENDWLLTTDPTDPAVRERLERGEQLIEVPSLADPLHQAQAVMHAARSRGEWEMRQTHESLLEYLEQETAEVAEAIRTNGSDDELKKELSDLLLQVLFHAEIASRRSSFAFPDVAQAFVDKMRNRAPYLFDGSTGIVPEAEQDRLWAEGKRREARSTEFE